MNLNFLNPKDLLDAGEKYGKGKVIAAMGILAGVYLGGKYLSSRIKEKAKRKTNDLKAQADRETAKQEHEERMAEKQKDAELKEHLMKTEAELKIKVMEKAAEIKNRAFSENKEQEAGVENPSKAKWEGRTSDDIFDDPEETDLWLIPNYYKVGQIGLLVAGGGVGKSNLMTQLGVCIAKSQTPEFLPPSTHSMTRQKVLYYRLEVRTGELQGKYGKEGYVIRNSGITWKYKSDLEDQSLKGLIADIKLYARGMNEDTTIIVDPATKLSDYNHIEFIEGMEEAQKIASENGCTLSILASLHMDEIKDWAPACNGDIKGGDKELQLAGAVYAFRRERTSKNHRFIQCMKEAKGADAPFDGEVLVVEADKGIIDDNNKYLHYKFHSIKPLSQALPEKPKAEKENTTDLKGSQTSKQHPNDKVGEEGRNKIKEWKEQGVSVDEMARRLKVKRITILRNIEKIEKEQEVKNIA